jgi:hypothetical protein
MLQAVQVHSDTEFDCENCENRGSSLPKYEHDQYFLDE